MSINRRHRGGWAWLESLLVVAFVALVFQVFPSLWFGLIWAIDFRNWSRSIWMTLTVAGLGVLFALRFIPDLWENWRERQAAAAVEREKRRKQQQAKEQRQMIEAARRARSRRMY